MGDAGGAALLSALLFIEDVDIWRRGFEDCFSVRDLDFPNGGFGFHVVDEAISRDLEVEFAHTAQQGLAGFFVFGDL